MYMCIYLFIYKINIYINMCILFSDMPVEKRCSEGVFDARLKTCLRNSLTCVNG